MPEFEKKPKPTYQLLIEACLLFILFGVIVAAGCAIAIQIYNRLVSGL